MQKHISRRNLRKQLGSRTQRRVGTKTKAIPGQNNQKKGNDPQYRYWRKQTKFPRQELAELVREHEEDGYTVS